MKGLVLVLGLLLAGPASAGDAVKIGGATLAGHVVGAGVMGGVGFGAGAAMCGRDRFECYAPFLLGTWGAAIGPAIGGPIGAGSMSHAVGRRAWPAALVASSMGLAGGVLFVAGATSGRTAMIVAGGGVLLVGSPVVSGLVGARAPERPVGRVQAQPWAQARPRAVRFGVRGTF